MQRESKTARRRTSKLGITVAASLATLTIGAGTASAWTWFAPPHGYGNGLQPAQCTGATCTNSWFNGLLAKNGI